MALHQSTKATASQFLPLPALRKVELRPTLLAGILAMAAQGASAVTLDLGDNASLTWDNTLRYSSAWRLKDADAALLADPNGDDGNRNFDTGQFQSRFDWLSTADLNFGDYGVFVRGRAYYDDAYASSNDNDSALTNNNLSVPNDRFTEQTRDLIGKKAEVLDAFLYGQFDINDTFISLRAGRQVINWGESLFLQGGISSGQVPLDATRANSPGVELEEIYLPVGQFFAQINLTHALSFSGYYQYEWEETRLNPAGSYFSHQDFIDAGGESFILGSPAQLGPLAKAQRSEDQDPSDSGQYGLALRYLAEDLNYTEFGLYHLNYHDKLPQLTFDNFVMPVPGLILPTRYHLNYEEDIDLYGASFNTVVGGATLAGEVSYRQGQPVRLTAPLPTYERANSVQAQISALHVFGNNPLMDNLIFAGEVGVNRINGYESALLFNDRSAWGFTAQITPEYYGVLSGLDMKLPITISHGANGDSSIPGSFTDGVTNVGITAKFRYLDNYEATLGYTGFFGDADDNMLKDRDFVSVSLTYTF